MTATEADKWLFLAEAAIQNSGPWQIKREPIQIEHGVIGRIVGVTEEMQTKRRLDLFYYSVKKAVQHLLYGLPVETTSIHVWPVYSLSNTDQDVVLRIKLATKKDNK